MAVRSESVGDTSILMEELAVLQAIYIHELVIEEDESHHPSTIVLELHPATCDDLTKRFVCMTLVLKPPLAYPDEIPEICIRNPRGVGDEELQSLQEAMNDLAEFKRGGPMLYQLIEMAKETLTEGNIPRCPCVICQEHFDDGDEFTRTDCYHYFHQSCFARYIKHALAETKDSDKETEVVCPVCRETLRYDLADLEDCNDVDLDDYNYVPSQHIRDLQKQMAELLIKQKSKGGIIDLQEEKDKYLVNADIVISLPFDEQTASSVRDKAAHQSKTVRGARRYQYGNSRGRGNCRANMEVNEVSSARTQSRFRNGKDCERRNESGKAGEKNNIKNNFDERCESGQMRRNGQDSVRRGNRQSNRNVYDHRPNNNQRYTERNRSNKDNQYEKVSGTISHEGKKVQESVDGEKTSLNDALEQTSVQSMESNRESVVVARDEVRLSESDSHSEISPVTKQNKTSSTNKSLEEGTQESRVYKQPSRNNRHNDHRQHKDYRQEHKNDRQNAVHRKNENDGPKHKKSYDNQYDRQETNDRRTAMRDKQQDRDYSYDAQYDTQKYKDDRHAAYDRQDDRQKYKDVRQDDRQKYKDDRQKYKDVRQDDTQKYKDVRQDDTQKYKDDRHAPYDRQDDRQKYKDDRQKYKDVRQDDTQKYKDDRHAPYDRQDDRQDDRQKYKDDRHAPYDRQKYKDVRQDDRQKYKDVRQDDTQKYKDDRHAPYDRQDDRQKYKDVRQDERQKYKNERQVDSQEYRRDSREYRDYRNNAAYHRQEYKYRDNRHNASYYRQNYNDERQEHESDRSATYDRKYYQYDKQQHEDDTHSVSQHNDNHPNAHYDNDEHGNDECTGQSDVQEHKDSVNDTFDGLSSKDGRSNSNARNNPKFKGKRHDKYIINSARVKGARNSGDTERHQAASMRDLQTSEYVKSASPNTSQSLSRKTCKEKLESPIDIQNISFDNQRHTEQSTECELSSKQFGREERRTGSQYSEKHCEEERRTGSQYSEKHCEEKRTGSQYSEKHCDEEMFTSDDQHAQSETNYNTSGREISKGKSIYPRTGQYHTTRNSDKKEENWTSDMNHFTEMELDDTQFESRRGRGRGKSRRGPHYYVRKTEKDQVKWTSDKNNFVETGKDDKQLESRRGSGRGNSRKGKTNSVSEEEEQWTSCRDQYSETNDNWYGHGRARIGRGRARTNQSDTNRDYHRDRGRRGNTRFRPHSEQTSRKQEESVEIVVGQDDSRMKGKTKSNEQKSSSCEFESSALCDKVHNQQNKVNNLACGESVNPASVVPPGFHLTSPPPGFKNNPNQTDGHLVSERTHSSPLVKPPPGFDLK